jgi:hypothetical protein
MTRGSEYQSRRTTRGWFAYPGSGFDPRSAYPGSGFDPRSAYLGSGFDPRFAYQGPGFDPRFGPPIPATDPRFVQQIQTLDPRLGYPGSLYEPRFGYPGPMYDPRFGSWANPLPPGAMLGLDGQTMITGAGFPFANGFPFLGPVSVPGPGAPVISSPGSGMRAQPSFAPYLPQYRLTGLPTDAEIEEIINDALDHNPAIPLDADLEIKCDAGQVVLSGTVPDKRIKRAAGEVAWWIPGVTDVNNGIVVTGRRQAQATRRRKRQETASTGR